MLFTDLNIPCFYSFMCLCGLALLSLTESMKKDPDKFNAFIFCDNKSLSSTIQKRGYSQYYDTVPYGQQQQQYPSQDCIDVLLDEAEKLYNKLAKEMVDESISDYAFSISPSPLLPPSNEEQQPWPTKRLPQEKKVITSRSFFDRIYCSLNYLFISFCYCHDLLTVM